MLLSLVQHLPCGCLITIWGIFLGHWDPDTANIGFSGLLGFFLLSSPCQRRDSETRYVGFSWPRAESLRAQTQEHWAGAGTPRDLFGLWSRCLGVISADRSAACSTLADFYTAEADAEPFSAEVGLWTFCACFPCVVAVEEYLAFANGYQPDITYPIIWESLPGYFGYLLAWC